MLALLTAGRSSEDVLLETVRLRYPQVDLELGLGGQGERGADGGRAGRERRVGAEGRGQGRRALVAQGRLLQGRRRRLGDEAGGEAEFTVVLALEEVIHALAPHYRLEGQGALQPLEL